MKFDASYPSPYVPNTTITATHSTSSDTRITGRSERSFRRLWDGFISSVRLTAKSAAAPMNTGRYDNMLNPANLPPSENSETNPPMPGDVNILR